MKLHAVRIGATVLLAALVSIGAARAGPYEDHRQLQRLLQDAARAPSDPDTCDTYLSPATSAAQSLATASCSTGYTVSGIHGVLIAIRGLLKVGNVCLHRHGCKDESREALLAARQILLSTDLSCLSGDEMQAQVAGLNEAFLAASGLGEGVPASNPELYPPPPGAPQSSNHCVAEKPSHTAVYAAARAYVDTQISPPEETKSGGSVTCEPSDPANRWRAAVKVTSGAGPSLVVEVSCDISTMTCN